MAEEKRMDRMGLVIVMAHLIITLAILGMYTYSMFVGVGDDTLRNILMIIIGYWFGAMGTDAIKQRVVKKNVDQEERKEKYD